MNTLTTTTHAAPAREARVAPSARPTGFAHDTAAVFVREARPLVRDPFSVVFSLVQPLVFLGLFGPLLVGAAGGDVAGTLQWFVPGILVMVALFGTASTGANLLFDRSLGAGANRHHGEHRGHADRDAEQRQACLQAIAAQRSEGHIDHRVPQRRPHALTCSRLPVTSETISPSLKSTVRVP